MSFHSSGSLEGGCPSSAEIIEDTEDFIQFERLYSLFSIVERFLCLRDSLTYFGLIGFLLKFERLPQISFQRFIKQAGAELSQAQTTFGKLELF